MESDLENYLKIHQKSHLIFDLDETLVHLILPWNVLIERIDDKLKEMDKSLYKQVPQKGYFLNALENAYVNKYGKKAKDFFIKYRVEFEKELKDIKINYKLVAFVKELQGYKFYIWSSNTQQTVKSALKKIKLENKFEKIIADQDVALLKPEIEGFNKIYDSKIPRDKYLLIGDSQSDEEAAKNSSIDFFYVDYFK